MEDSVHPAPESRPQFTLPSLPDAIRNVAAERCDGDVKLRLLKLMRIPDQRRAEITGYSDHGITEISGVPGTAEGSLGWETGIEPATVGATVRCSAS